MYFKLTFGQRSHTVLVEAVQFCTIARGYLQTRHLRQVPRASCWKNPLRQTHFVQLPTVINS